jgi:hypothetical protein
MTVKPRGGGEGNIVMNLYESNTIWQVSVNPVIVEYIVRSSQFFHISS